MVSKIDNSFVNFSRVILLEINDLLREHKKTEKNRLRLEVECMVYQTLRVDLGHMKEIQSSQRVREGQGLEAKETDSFPEQLCYGGTFNFNFVFSLSGWAHPLFIVFLVMIVYTEH